ncbi:uncharacterized protein LOC132546296 isoform X2 [Ylistrum balloti]|uniref:uncharacterized protein LOC132546296 isoform X2 n=1 Tax=Ylistrum balloti TaxID=509963 RepID=UPI002905E9A2|nr:uncharacterized protein LOC132546296 isoform X2 [Ylistrum balloti]
MSSFEENHLPNVAVNDLGKPSADGYLEKKRKEKKFRSEKLQKRWCVIQDDNFYYFIKPTDPKQKGGFNLKGYSFQKLGDLSFSIKCEGKRHYEFVAPSKEEAAKWRKAIMKGSLKKKLRKSDSFPGGESIPPASPTRDRSVSIPADAKDRASQSKLKYRSHTPDPFERSPNISSRDRSNTLGRDFGKAKQKTEPSVKKPPSYKSKPQLNAVKNQSIDDHGYATVIPRLDKNEHGSSSSDNSDSDYDIVDPVRQIPTPRPTPVQKAASGSEIVEERNLSQKRHQMPIPTLPSQNPVSSDDEEDYDVPDEPFSRPESDYDIAGNFLRKVEKSCATTNVEEDDNYIDAAKLDSMPNTNRRKTPIIPAPMKCQLDTEQDEEDLYFEPISGPLYNDKKSCTQTQNILDCENEDPYFIPVEESAPSEEEDPYFEPISDYDKPDATVLRSNQTPQSQMFTTDPGQEQYIRQNRKPTLTRNSSRSSDGYSKPEEVILYKRKQPTEATKKSNNYTDDSNIYVNLPFFKNQQIKEEAQLDNTQSKNTMKLQNVKLKDSVEDNSYSDSDDYDYTMY